VRAAGPITEPFRASCVVGNLSREEAHTYFFDHVLRSRNHPPLEKEAWPRVYEVCGGNPGLLQMCVTASIRLMSWEKGAECIPAGPVPSS
jgi:hypothetical protein